MDSIIILAAAAVFVFLFIKLLTKPIKGLLKFALHAALGYVLLFIVNFFGSTVGIGLDTNLLNAAIIGFFGVPGVIVLVLLKLFF